jgi:hypothetical protein
MLVVKLLSVVDYWSTSDIFYSVLPKFIGRNKFELISRFLHLADNCNSNNTDKIYKIRSFLNLINDISIQHALPGKIINIDEYLIPFRGRIVFHQ